MKTNLKTRVISLILAFVLLFSSMTVLSYAFEGVEIIDEEILDPEYKGNGDNKVPSATEGVYVQYNRTFDDGYSGLGVGINIVRPKEHTFAIATDTDGSKTGVKGNKYLKMTANAWTEEKDGYLDFVFDGDQAGKTIAVKLDVFYDRSQNEAVPGTFIRFKTTSESNITFRGLEFMDGGYRTFEDDTTLKTDAYSRSKHTLTYVIEPVGSNQLKTNVYIDGTFWATKTVTADFMYTLRIGFFGSQKTGTEIGLDNVAIYYCDEGVDPLNADLGYNVGYDIDEFAYRTELFMKLNANSALSSGKKIDVTFPAVSIDDLAYIPVDVLAKHLGYTLNIAGDTLLFTKVDANSITLTIGSYNATVAGSTVALRKAVASVNGVYPVIYYRDVENIFDGYFGSYNDMGVVVVSKLQGYATIASDTYLVDVMKRFIFEAIDENKEQVYVVDYNTFIGLNEETGEKREHPYILANADDFAYFREIYNKGPLNNPEPVLYSYLVTVVESAETTYNKYKKETGGVCTGVSSTYAKGLVMPYDNERDNGYDPDGGRQNDTDSYADIMEKVAFGYQITGNKNYARLAYYVGKGLGTYEHWGPAHFLNCADTAAPFALAYDWLYNAWIELESEDPENFQLNTMTDALFRNGVLAGWYAVTYVRCPWLRRHDSKKTTPLDSSKFFDNTNNWNAVCSAGMIVVSLALATETDTIDPDRVRIIKQAELVKNEDPETMSSYDYKFVYTMKKYNELGDHTGFTSRVYSSGAYVEEQHTYNSYADYAYYLFSRLQYTLPLYGLDFYAPDGSYVEGAGYWEYSADNLFLIGAYGDTVFSEDFGLISNCWGLDKTCYYALNVQSSDYSYWNYSDSTDSLVPGSVSTKSFPYIAYELGDPGLAAIRKDMIASGKYKAGFFDVVYYRKNESATNFELPELQYHMASIDAYVARDSWEPGSTYVAIKGGYNDSAHGQVDSGGFVYHNNGKIWFADVGTDDYNLYGWGGTINGYRYYKTNAEGNNTLALSTNPLSDTITASTPGGTTSCCFAGQWSYGTGYMYEVGDNEHGAYALIDQTEVYYKSAIDAKRGMLFTNDRSTVVIQDEVSFYEPETVYWIGHTYQEIYVSTDGKSAYMTDGESVIRVSLISSVEDLKFDIISCYEFLLEDTFRPDFAINNGMGVPEDDRSSFKRLIVKCENVTELNLSVVIEDVTADTDMEVGYTFVPMDEWVPSSDARVTAPLDLGFDFDENSLDYNVSGNLDIYKSYFVDSNMLTVLANEDTAIGDKMSLLLPKSAFVSAYIAKRAIVFDVDLYSDSNADGLALAVSGNGDIIAKAPLASLVKTGGEWSHVTVVATEKAIYFFKDGSLVTKCDLESKSYKGATLEVVATSLSGGTVSLDNLGVRCVDTSLLDFDDIEAWDGYVGLARERAMVFSFEGEPGNIIGYTFSELLALDYEGKEITLYHGNEHAPLAIDKACKVIHGNNVFRASSPALSAFISGGATEFKSESITVYWHIGNTIETSQVAGMNYAKYTGRSREVNKYSKTVVGGKTIYYTTTWSTTPGGKVSSAEDMLVTSENCNFYLVKDVAKNPYFYEIAGGTIYAGDNPAMLLSHLNRNGYTVTLNKDVNVAASGITILNFSVVNLNLNGYTLNYERTGGSHMFVLDNGAINIYGNGGTIKLSGGGNMFHPLKGSVSEVYVENATLESESSFVDQRVGVCTYKNVIFNQNSATGGSIMVVQNRSNSSSSIQTILDGCTLNSLKSTESKFIVSLQMNASILVTGGTEINAPNAIAFKLYNTYNGGDFSRMAIDLEDAKINTATLYTIAAETKTIKEAEATSVNVFNDSFKASVNAEQRELILSMAEKLKIGENVAFKSSVIPSRNIIDGCKLARQDDPTLPYYVTSEYTKVSWVAGANAVFEYWKNGTYPEADNSEVMDNIASLNASAPAGKKYVYSTSVVNGGEVTFVATQLTDFNISMSLSLEASMKVKLYVEKRSGVNVRGFAIDGVEVEYTITTLDDGKQYYMAVLPRVIPTKAADRHECAVTVLGADGREADMRIYFSVTDYCEKILSASDKYSAEAVGLMANILKYLAEAYKYEGLVDTEGYKTINTMLMKYVNKVTCSVVKKTEAPDITDIKDALKSVQVILSDAPRYRFGLVDGYTGVVTLGYTEIGERKTQSFNIVDGKFDGKDYIELELMAYDLRGDINIVTACGIGVYNLATYYNAIGKTNSASALLDALYAYSEMAEAYKRSSD